MVAISRIPGTFSVALIALHQIVSSRLHTSESLNFPALGEPVTPDTVFLAWNIQSVAGVVRMDVVKRAIT